jgi:hypothetical protein
MPATTALHQSRLRCRRVRFLKLVDMARQSPETPASEWMTYSAAAERLGLSPSSIALRAGRWPMRKRVDTGEVEIEVPGTLLTGHTIKRRAGADQELRSRAAEALNRAHTSGPRGQARILTKIGMALTQTWWRFSRWAITSEVDPRRRLLNSVRDLILPRVLGPLAQEDL